MNSCQIVFITLVILNVQNFAIGVPVVPCYFIFGDSMVDSGNNNALQTLAKVNYGPYGIDFPEGPTGRFTNGQTVADVIAKALGLDYIPPFATANGPEILQGVNYASGSCGIREESGQHQGNCISLSKQLANHQTTVSRIADLLKSNNTTSSEYLSKCLYALHIGSNDYINNYFLPQIYNTSNLYPPEEYAKVLVEQYSIQIRTLYGLGARKMYLGGVGVIGCTPNATSIYPTNGSRCVYRLNYAASLFNQQLRLVVEKLNSEFSDAKFVFIDPIKMVSAVSASVPRAEKPTPCCEVDESGLCIPNKSPCQNRDSTSFWDAFHPTEAINVVQGNRILNSLDQSELYPMNVLQLAQCQPKASY